MNTKLIALSLAGMMTMNSVAFAQVSRVDGIGEASIQTAYKELLIIQNDLGVLDQALEKTAVAIQKRHHSGSMASAFAVSTASLGLGLAALAFSVRKIGATTGMGTLLSMTAMSAAAVKTSASMALTLVSEVQKGFGSTQDARQALAKARQEIEAAKASQNFDDHSLSKMAELDQALSLIQTNLADYRAQDTTEKSLRLVGLLGQAAGIAVTFYTGAGMITQGSTTSKAAILVGPILMSVGNLAMLASELKESDSETLLQAIHKTRQGLADASQALVP